MASTYHQLGITAQDRGQLDEADDWYRKSLTIKEELGNRPGMAITYHQLGITAQDRGRLDEADDWYRKSLAIKEELGNRPGMAATYHQLGITAQDRGRLDEAETGTGGSPREVPPAGTYHQLGIPPGRGVDEAEDWYRRSLAIEELGDRRHAAATTSSASPPRTAGGWTRPTTGTANPSPSTKNSATGRGMALTYGQLGLLAEDRQQAAPGPGLEHPVRDLVRPVPAAG